MESLNLPLSNTDIQEKTGCKFILYSDMHNIKDIRELLPQTLILYELADIGHFCCIFQNDELEKNTINFFDPLGYIVDDELQLIPKDRRIRLKHNFTYLTQLLANQQKSIVVNQYKLQSKHTSSCGHWVTIRLLCSTLHNDEFYKCFKNIKDRDNIIVKLYNTL